MNGYATLDKERFVKQAAYIKHVVYAERSELWESDIKSILETKKWFRKGVAKTREQAIKQLNELEELRNWYSSVPARYTWGYYILDVIEKLELVLFSGEILVGIEELGSLEERWFNYFKTEQVDNLYTCSLRHLPQVKETADTEQEALAKAQAILLRDFDKYYPELLKESVKYW